MPVALSEIRKIALKELEKTQSDEEQWSYLFKTDGNEEFWYYTKDDLDDWEFDPEEFDGTQWTCRGLMPLL